MLKYCKNDAEIYDVFKLDFEEEIHEVCKQEISDKELHIIVKE